MMDEGTDDPNFVKRELEAALLRRLEENGRIILLFGARRVGKTTLTRHLIASLGAKSLELTGTI
jgi:predicted AAA+ superfamily ATPase